MDLGLSDFNLAYTYTITSSLCLYRKLTRERETIQRGPFRAFLFLFFPTTYFFFLSPETLIFGVHEQTRILQISGITLDKSLLSSGPQLPHM